MIEQKLMEYLRETSENYEIEFNKTYIRLGYWERGSNNFEKFLESLGFVLDTYFDEDRGYLFSYKKCVMGICMGDSYIAQKSFHEKQVIATATDIVAPDEHNAGDVIFLGDDGKTYFERELLLIKKL